LASDRVLIARTTFALVMLGIAGATAALMASYVLARRAGVVNPVDALRAE
jgi:ABC-type lipoprotein release transport system permease subunit